MPHATHFIFTYILFPSSLFDHRLPLWVNGFRNGVFESTSPSWTSSSSRHPTLSPIPIIFFPPTKLLLYLPLEVTYFRCCRSTVRLGCGQLTRSLESKKKTVKGNRLDVCICVYVYVCECVKAVDAVGKPDVIVQSGVCSARFRSRPFAELTFP